MKSYLNATGIVLTGIVTTYNLKILWQVLNTPITDITWVLFGFIILYLVLSTIWLRGFIDCIKEEIIKE